MSHRLSRFLSAAAWAGLLFSCGGPGRVSEETAPAPPAPTALLLEKTIAGAVQGVTIKQPGALAVSDRGAVYLLDGGNQRVVWFSSDLISLRDYSGQGNLTNRFSDPRSLAVDADRNVWISDFGNRRLVRTSNQLEISNEIEFRDDSAYANLGRPGGLAVTKFGDLWVVDLDNQRIVVMNPLGDIEQIVGDFGSPGGKLDYPSKLFSGPDGYIWVCDRGNRRVVVYDDDGGLVREIGSGILEDPVAVVIDAARRSWVLDERSGKIYCFDREGQYLSAVGPVISGADQPLLRPSDLAFLPDGRLLISDTGHDRLLLCRVQ